MICTQCKNNYKEAFIGCSNCGDFCSEVCYQKKHDEKGCGKNKKVLTKA